MTDQQIRQGVIVAVCVAVALGAVVLFAAPNDPKAQMQRIKDECERTYGLNSQASVDCFVRLSLRAANERQSGELERIYQKVR